MASRHSALNYLTPNEFEGLHSSATKRRRFVIKDWSTFRELAQLERATRIELAFSAWEADVLPLNYARGQLNLNPAPFRILWHVARQIHGLLTRGCTVPSDCSRDSYLRRLNRTLHVWVFVVKAQTATAQSRRSEEFHEPCVKKTSKDYRQKVAITALVVVGRTFIAECAADHRFGVARSHHDHGLTNAAWGPTLTLINGDTFNRVSADSKDLSRCTGQCAVFWPPVLLAAGQKIPVGKGVSGLGSFVRSNGAPGDP